MVNPGLDLWVAAVEAAVGAEWTDRYLGLLSDEERHTLRACAVEADRHAYLLAHVLLRLALSHYGGLPPKRGGSAANRAESRACSTLLRNCPSST